MRDCFARFPVGAGRVFLSPILFLLLAVAALAQTGPAITDIRLDGAGRTVVRVGYSADSYYLLLRGDEVAAIGTLTDLESLPEAGAPPEVELVDATPPSATMARFYRVEQVPLAAPKDSDGDGMDDVYELGYRPLLDPLNPADAAGDPDGDGRSNLDEYRAGTNPFVANPPPPPASPVLAALPVATQGVFLELTGTGPTNAYIRVEGAAYVATNLVRPDGTFTVPLVLSSNRLNRLFVSAVGAGGVTSAGRPVEVLHDSQPPTLFADFPTNAAVLHAEATLVAGRVGDSLSGYAGLFVWVHSSPSEGDAPLATATFPTNSPLRATVDVGIGPNGTFQRGGVPLAVGTNLITAVATDALGNRTLRQLEVIRLPLEGPRLLAVAGDLQATNAVRRLPEPLVVRAARPDGSPIADAPLLFEVTRSNGRLRPVDTNLLTADWTREPSADTNGAMRLELRTDAAGEARVWWTLGSDAGSANNRVCVGGPGLSNMVFFCASALAHPARQLNLGSGNNQKVEAGAPVPEPLRVWASDGLNPALAVPVTFRVVQGGGRLLPGGRDGALLSPLPPGEGPGVRARAGVPPLPAGEGLGVRAPAVPISHSPSPIPHPPSARPHPLNPIPSTELVVATGVTGHASVGFIAGPDGGQNVVEATFPGQFGLPVTFIVYGVARDLTQPGSFTGPSSTTPAAPSAAPSAPSPPGSINNQPLRIPKAASGSRTCPAAWATFTSTAAPPRTSSARPSPPTASPASATPW